MKLKQITNAAHKENLVNTITDTTFYSIIIGANRRNRC